MYTTWVYCITKHIGRHCQNLTHSKIRTARFHMMLLAIIKDTVKVCVVYVTRQSVTIKEGHKNFECAYNSTSLVKSAIIWWNNSPSTRTIPARNWCCAPVIRYDVTHERARRAPNVMIEKLLISLSPLLYHCECKKSEIGMANLWTFFYESARFTNYLLYKAMSVCQKINETK